MTALTREAIRDTLIDAFSRASNGRVKHEHIDYGARIIEDVGLSSLDLLELRCELEEICRTSIRDDELMQLRTVGDAVDLIAERLLLTFDEHNQ